MTFGWFEPGGGVNKYFVNTKMIDVVMRTSTLSNTLVLGNTAQQNQSSTRAGLYISNNCVGVQRIADPGFSLDVGAKARFNSTLECGQTLVTQSNLRLGSTLLAESAMVCGSYLTPDRTLAPVTVRQCSVATSGAFALDFVFAPSPLLEAISPGMFVQMSGDVIYKVVATPLTNAITIELHTNFDPATALSVPPFQPGQEVAITILKNIQGKQNQGTNAIKTWFTIRSSVLVGSDTWSGAVTFTGPISLAPGQYYSFGPSQTVQNIVQLASLVLAEEIPGIVTGTVTLRTVDGATFPETSAPSALGPDSIYALIHLDVIPPPTFQDPNAIMGSYAFQDGDPQANYVLFKNTSIARYINATNTPTTNPIKTITVNGVLTYEFSNMLKTAPSNVIGQLASTTTPYTFTVKGTAAYSLVGSPISISSVAPSTFQGKQSYVYRVNDPLNILPTLQTSFLNGQIYFCHMMATRATLFAVNLILGTIELDTSILVPSPSYLFYIVPFRESRISALGAACSVSNRLAVGAQSASETLTVAGDASFRGKIILNDDLVRGNAFPITFSSNALTFGHALQATPNSVTITQNTAVNGTVIANDYLKYSDRRIKKNIRAADGHRDLEMIKQLRIVDFDFKEAAPSAARQKGVLAQDLERIAPTLVTERAGFMPSICHTARSTTSGALVLPAAVTKDAADALKPGTRLHIKLDGGRTSRYVTITRFRIKRGAAFLKTNEQYPVGTPVYIRGPYGRTKVINKDALLMTLISGIQALF